MRGESPNALGLAERQADHRVAVDSFDFEDDVGIFVLKARGVSSGTTVTSRTGAGAFTATLTLNNGITSSMTSSASLRRSGIKCKR